MIIEEKQPPEKSERERERDTSVDDRLDLLNQFATLLALPLSPSPGGQVQEPQQLIDAICTELSHFSELKANLSLIEKEREELNRECFSQKDQLVKLERELAQIKESCTRKDEQLDELETSVQNLEDELERVLSLQKKKPDDDIDVSSLSLSNKEPRLEPEGSEREDLILEQKVSKELEELKIQMGKISSERDSLSLELLKLKSERDELGQQLENFTNQMNLFQMEQDFAKQGLNSKLMELSSEREGLLQERQSMFQKLEQAQLSQRASGEIDELKSEREGLASRIEVLERESAEFKENYEQIQEQLKGSIEEREVLMKRLEESEQVFEQLKRDNQNFGSIQEQLKVLVQEKEDLMKRLEESEQQSEQLKRENQNRQNDFGSIEEQLRMAAQEKEELMNRLKESEQLQEELQNRKGIDEACTRLSAQLMEKEREVSTLQNSLSSFQASLSSLEATLKESNLERDRLRQELDRLKLHLVQVEENYTNELMLAEKRTEEMVDQLDKIQAEALDSTAYEERIRNLITAKEKARNEVSSLEDKVQQYSTSISNLQGVIEQLEKEHSRKEKQLEQENAKNLELERVKTSEVVRKLQAQEERLRETLEALEAASRLTETIDQKEFQINQLRREVKTREGQIDQLQLKIHELETSYEGKVDKQIIKSLLISYLATAHGSQARSEGERLLARFLDFNQQELERVGIKVGRGRAQTSDQGFASKFVEFLDAESVKKSTEEANAQRLRRDSTNLNPVNQNQMELARDLNKRLNLVPNQLINPTGPVRVVNPFVPQPQGSAPGVYQHHRTPSTASTGSQHSLTEGNQLFAGMGVAGVGVNPILVPTTQATNISDVVRNVVTPNDGTDIV